MATKRQHIESLRTKIKERNADSNFTNQFLYSVLLEQSKWLIKREISAGRIYSNTTFFKPLSCQEVIESSTVDPCCPVKVNCKIYRTKNKVPGVWIDNLGPVVRDITSVDGSTDFFITSPTTWQSKKRDPYQKMVDTKYTFYANEYFWFPEHNPHRVTINGFFMDDVSHLNGCREKKECVRYLDTEFMLPGWLEAEMFAKALEQIINVTKRLPNDEQIDKNETRKS